MNNTQNTNPDTSNPQQAVPANGASNAADFQSTAPEGALQTSTQDLTVQQTGEPASGDSSQTGTSSSTYVWVGGVVLLLLVGIVLLVRLIKEAIDENAAPAATRSSRPAASSAAKPKAQSKAAAKKASTKKKPASKGQKRKKSASRKK